MAKTKELLEEILKVQKRILSTLESNSTNKKAAPAELKIEKEPAKKKAKKGNKD